MTAPDISAVRLGGSPSLPLLVLGPSLGTSARALWSRCAAGLGDRFEVLAWDLPGHGSNTEVSQPFSIADLAAGVRTLVDDVLTDRGEPGGSFSYAGDSVGGAVGLQLLLDLPARVDRAVLVCTGAVIGTPQSWHERAALVRASGTVAMVERATRTWFAPGFPHLEPAVATDLLQSLRDADDEGYAQVCEALAGFDVRDRLSGIRTPVVAVAGSIDPATPVAGLQEIASGVRNGRLVVLDDVAHLAPAEMPDRIARIIRDDPETTSTVAAEPRSPGMTVRREVLGDAYVDRAIAGSTDLTRDFQDFVTDYAWGGVWTRPGLDRRSRSIVALTAAVAGGHHQELAVHVRGALTNGLTRNELSEVLLQTAVYCGVPAAQSAFRVAQQVLDEIDEE
ncbi:alpha/beta fold hydrolase [Allobranchiibius sp. CTAmp26]|uniref:bifunctional 3-oxoadipate enol-lactonase/4-carboxymuconolactone decarboxylase PcaDC n=1 Tax=Allobranchiibius sp. CTAmp26 TaxID=2815214 RepID=UPI0027DD0370|nr:alpha/beta fold hydrolase [Allobranchiibius sp. CTAmp26]